MDFIPMDILRPHGTGGAGVVRTRIPVLGEFDPRNKQVGERSSQDG